MNGNRRKTLGEIKLSNEFKKAATSGNIHLEILPSAYEKLKNAFDKVREQIDAGIKGDINDSSALFRARSSLYDLGQLVEKEVLIVQMDEKAEENGGAA